MSDLKFFYSQDDAYWDAYLAARPKYQLSKFYEHILEYHRDINGGKLDVAHDVACGPGQIAAELIKRFGHVVASDANPEHVKVAERRITAQSSSNCSFVVSTAEDIFKHAESSSVDFITCGEAIALVDAQRFLSAAAKILKPKGTLVIWHYGRPYFLDGKGELDEKVNKAYLKLADHLLSSLIHGNVERFQTPVTHIHCWFDDMLVGEQWEYTQRQKINHDLELLYFSPDLEGLSTKLPPSVVGANGIKEEVIDKIDRDFWSENWASSDAVNFAKANMPIFDPARFEDDGFRRCVAELEEAFGGSDGKRQVCWPVFLMFATRK